MPFPSGLVYPTIDTYPGGDVPVVIPETGLVWGNPSKRYFQHGIDRGVLYTDDAPPVVWNGITGCTEAGGGDSSVYYIDGRIYLADVDPGDYSGSVTAYDWPDEFAQCIGIPEVTDGLYVDNQKPQRCGISYRSLVGSGLTGDMFGYMIHLIYNAVPSIGARTRKTINDKTEPMDFTFDIVATPVSLPGFRPSAHYILDTRHLDSSTVANLELILYGDGETAGRMPDPIELYDMLRFGDAITFVDHSDGTWTATGSFANVHMTGDDTWEILNVNGTDNGDGTYELEDTP